MKNFAIAGVAGFVAPRHLKAIKDTGNQLIAALDPHDSVGILDSYFPSVQFFAETERFDRFLEKLRQQEDDQRMHIMSICSPNYLHDAHIRLALRLNADAICEKPLVINPWNLNPLVELEVETGQRVYTVLQLRLHPALQNIRQALSQTTGTKQNVVLTYITSRGSWYHQSWKGNPEKSGGLAMNIGVHLFDLLIWLFGAVESSEVHLAKPDRMAGKVELERARVRWFLSVNAADLPAYVRQQGKSAFRTLVADGQEIEFSEGFTGLHTRIYENVLAGQGFGIAETRPALELVYQINHSTVVPSSTERHPFLS